MAVDEVLLDRAARDALCTLRLYRWKEPTLSLGYFQSLEERQRHPASLACPVVRRPSGGGAIVHDIELTYALAVPASLGWARRRDDLYRVVHQSLIHVLGAWGIPASLYGGLGQAAEGSMALLGQRPSRLGIPERTARATCYRDPFLCFQRRAPGDVVVGDCKVAGSAQRRLAGAVLQHGSILLGRSAAAPELPGLERWMGKAVDAHRLAEAWIKVLGPALELDLRPSPLSRDEEAQVRHLAERKYGSPVWTARR